MNAATVQHTGGQECGPVVWRASRSSCETYFTSRVQQLPKRKWDGNKEGQWLQCKLNIFLNILCLEETEQEWQNNHIHRHKDLTEGKGDSNLRSRRREHPCRTANGPILGQNSRDFLLW
ncbi:hypothetical protein Y1Q_0015267 [Alligator mississippiensis]|uniref:Uncharacterized protein n=1 Tax=Alligator mississippiensis TaxID=8496 RepID=A0A151NL57_ALLMI|nr:hypothetical protein Y1Q_0015267 [Alligator mississippiensis]